MTLGRTLIEMVQARGSATADDLAPLLPQYTRAQVMQALQNAKRRGALFIAKRGGGLGYGRGSELARYTVIDGYVLPQQERFGPSFHKWIEERSIRDEDETGCWHWQLFVDSGTRPKGKRNGRNINVRRELWSEQHNGRAMPASWIAVCRHGTGDCTNPDHVTGAKLGHALRCKPLTLAQRAAIANGCRKVRKLSTEDALLIRDSDEPRDVLAQRYGITKAHVGHIKTQRAWRDYASPFAGLFTGLVASNESTTRRTA